MIFEKPKLHHVRNESDVEQKFIHPLLVAERPTGFGLRTSAIITKVNVRRFEIEKGSQKKLYYPDYVIVIGGLPLAVVECKGPNVELDEAFREARLYSQELNALFPAKNNPVAFVCASNAKETWLGYVDQAEPVLRIPFDEIEPYSQKMAEAQGFLGLDALRRHSSVINSNLKLNKYCKPRRMIGGLAVEQEEVGQNSFGATLAAELSHIFNPQTREDRLRIARDAYVSSPRRDRYVGPIDQVIRAATPIAQSRSRLIADPRNPTELLEPFHAQRELAHQIMLLLGERGSGKTTFLYHLQAVALPQDIRDRTIWVHIDVNAGPVVKGEIYDWTRKELIAGIRQRFPNVDFDSYETIEKIYAVEVNGFNKGIGKLLPEGSVERSHELYKILLSCQSDLDKTAKCYTRHFGSERGSLIVVVFDNADKQPRDEQLLMFEVAQWLQKQFRVLVVLPIREETYDNHRDQPPLDTALKDLVFRIEPPIFQQALIRRVQLALDELAKSRDRRKNYELANGFRVVYAETDRSYYLAAIAASVFQYDSYVRRLIMGLAGNDLRRVFEIFVEFCTSGHIGESEILKMRQAEGEYVLPLDVVLTVLLRSNRRYYDSDVSVLKNILDLDEKDERPSHFNRLLILSFLHKKFSEPGPSGLKGYFSLTQIHEALGVYGLSVSVIRREVSYLVAAECITAESLRTETVADSDLFRLGPVGFVHLELLGVPEYWAAVAEDTNFTERAIAGRIAERIVVRESHYSARVALQNARAAFDYMLKTRAKAARASEAILGASEFLSLTDIEIGNDSIGERSRSTQGGVWYEATERFPVGSEIEGTVVNSVPAHGLFIELIPGVTGLLHKSRLISGEVGVNAPKVGEKTMVRVTRIDADQRKLALSLISSKQP